MFTLEGQEGRMLAPLAFTKAFAMAAASLLSVTFVPVTVGIFIRGQICREGANPVNRVLVRLYDPVIAFVLRHRWPVIVGAVVMLALTRVPWTRLGSEFMPPLEEGTILFMPTTLPGVSVARAREIMRQQDAILKSFPEVQHVWGKAGRAETAIDPAGLDMFETTITPTGESEMESTTATVIPGRASVVQSRGSKMLLPRSIVAAAAISALRVCEGITASPVELVRDYRSRDGPVSM